MIINNVIILNETQCENRRQKNSVKLCALLSETQWENNPVNPRRKNSVKLRALLSETQWERKRSGKNKRSEKNKRSGKIARQKNAANVRKRLIFTKL